MQVVETCFASQIIVLTRLMQMKEALQSMVCSSLWNQWRQFQSERAQVVKRLVVDNEWWDRVEYLLAFTKPIVTKKLGIGSLRYTELKNLGFIGFITSLTIFYWYYFLNRENKSNISEL